MVNIMKAMKVTGYKIVEGQKALEDLVPSSSKNRRYCVKDAVYAIIATDIGALHVKTMPAFWFDGRSGGPRLDFYAPNLGSIEERVAWYMHDCLGYGGSLDFKSTNRILKLFLRDACHYRPSKAWLIETAVSLDKSWFGTPKSGDWCSINIGMVNTMWIPSAKSCPVLVGEMENIESRR